MQKFSQLYSQIVLKRRDNDEVYCHSTNLWLFGLYSWRKTRNSKPNCHLDLEGSFSRPFFMSCGLKQLLTSDLGEFVDSDSSSDEKDDEIDYMEGLYAEDIDSQNGSPLSSRPAGSSQMWLIVHVHTSLDLCTPPLPIIYLVHVPDKGYLKCCFIVSYCMPRIYSESKLPTFQANEYENGLYLVCL